MRRVCVFCGSNTGVRPEYAEATRGLADELVRRQVGVVYGGGSVGLMGVLADTVLGGGGEVIGVIPRPLASREVAHAGLTRLEMVDSMHERKATMASLADGFIALPGGLGTIEETLEIVTWAQLGIHGKPVALLNVNGYYDGLRAFLGRAVAEGFLRPEHLALLLFGGTPAEVLDRMKAWRAPSFRRAWLTPRQS